MISSQNNNASTLRFLIETKIKIQSVHQNQNHWPYMNPSKATKSKLKIDSHMIPKSHIFESTSSTSTRSSCNPNHSKSNQTSRSPASKINPLYIDFLVDFQFQVSCPLIIIDMKKSNEIDHQSIFKNKSNISIRNTLYPSIQ